MAIIVRYLLHVSLTHRGVLSQTLLALTLMAQSGCYLSISQGLMRSAERHFILTGVDEIRVGSDGSVALIGEGECRAAPPKASKITERPTRASDIALLAAMVLLPVPPAMPLQIATTLLHTGVAGDELATRVSWEGVLDGCASASVSGEYAVVWVALVSVIA